ncbi:hypothetical protein K435DRAFT_807948 [Dendrothele bispora CBS 962.96]|uniref:Uncharacterized protein n=1 Tax=Dendrothele bispora (strain CBS 962.96) TaxID=1314807 RepID=A0A4S8L3B4_DENBC|nr:hypothetical protein K435DRAFT_807948 [Dendrothele bispora CBS 962.96]
MSFCGSRKRGIDKTDEKKWKGCRMEGGGEEENNVVIPAVTLGLLASDDQIPGSIYINLTLTSFYVELKNLPSRRSSTSRATTGQVRAIGTPILIDLAEPPFVRKIHRPDEAPLLVVMTEPVQPAPENHCSVADIAGDAKARALLKEEENSCRDIRELHWQNHITSIGVSVLLASYVKVNFKDNLAKLLVKYLMYKIQAA